MTLTGVFLSLTISCKMVGLFAFLSVGTAVAVDLWNLLDVKRGLTIVRSAARDVRAPPVRMLVDNPDRNNSTATSPPVPSASSWSRRRSTSSGSGCTLPS